MTGRFITLEGGEGAGKSTHMATVADWLAARGRAVVRTREPGGSALAEAIRGIVLGDWPEGVLPETEVLLMFAARAAHVHATIGPALARGDDVVCDRFVDSSFAYQGAGKRVSRGTLATLERFVLGSLRPELTLVLDLDPEVGLARTRRRGAQNRFELEALEFQRRVRDAFVERARQDPARCVIIDAAADAAAVRSQIEGVLSQRFP